MKKKLLSLLLLGGLTLTAGAQTYQIPNGNFDSGWETTWNSFNTANNQLGSFVGGIAMSSSPKPSNETGRSGSGYSCKIYSANVLSKNANGNLTTGKINMGSTSPADAKNYNFSDIDDSSHSLIFNGRPDAVELWAKFTSGGSPNGRAQFIIHDEVDYRDPELDSQVGNRIGKASVLIPASADWVYYKSEFTYDKEYAGTQYLLANITTNPTPGGSANDYLWIDDIKMIYYSTLQTLTYNGANVSFPKYGGEVVIVSDGDYDASKLSYTLNGQTASAILGSYNASTKSVTITVSNVDADEDGNSTHTYTIKFVKPGTAALTDLTYNGITLTDFSSSTYNYILEGCKYTEGCLTYTKEDGEDATATLSFVDGNSAGYGIATINVAAIYGDAEKTYTIEFVPNLLSSKDFIDNLIVTVNGVSTAPQTTSINVKKYDDDTYTLSLDNFMLIDGEIIMPIGNIILNGLSGTVSNGVVSFNTTQTIQIQPGTLAGISPGDWMGPMLGDVPIEMVAKITPSGKMYCTIDIDMTGSLGQVINVYFGVVNNLETEALPDAEGVHVVLNRTFQPGWSTLYLQYDVTKEELGAVKVMEFDVYDEVSQALVFREVVGNNIGGNYPYLVKFDSEKANPFFANRLVSNSRDSRMSGPWVFTGTFTGIAAPGMEGKYGVTAAADGYQYIRRGGKNASIKGTRAFFEYYGEDQGVQQMRIRIEGEDGVTSIDGVETVIGSFDIYNLQGIRVRTAATSLEGLGRGVYVVNGKKVMVK